MSLKPNLKALKTVILKYIKSNNLKTVYECHSEFIKLLETSIEDGCLNYVIISDEEINYDYYMNMLWYNPLYVKLLSAPPNESNKINIKYFYETCMTLRTIEANNNSNRNRNRNSTLLFYNIYLENPVLIQNFMLTNFYIDGLDTYNKSGTQLDCKSNSNIYKNSDHYKKCSETFDTKDCVINCVYYNPNNCGYNFIEHIDTTVPENRKKVIFVIPYENKGIVRKRLGNFLDLDATHLPMLDQIKIIYGGKDKLIFVHKLSVFHKFYCIHFHVLDSKLYESLYKRIYPQEERSIYITQELHINNIINTLQNDGNYYKNYYVSIISNI